MTPEEVDECFATAVELVREAGKIVMEGYKTVKTVTEKSNPADLVTEFDTRVEEFLFSNLKAKYPSHKFIGEESASANTLQPTLSDLPTWIIDPIDGTINFVHNIPLLSISVALVVNKKSVLGIVFNPVMDEMYTAIANKGAYCNSEPIRVSTTKDLSKALVTALRSLPTPKNSRIRNDLGLVAHMRDITHGNVRLGCFTIEMCYVAKGSIDASYIDSARMFCWDVAAASLIIQEAGGIVLDTTGGPFDMMKGRVFSAGTQELATVVLKEIKSYLRSSSSE